MKVKMFLLFITIILLLSCDSPKEAIKKVNPVFSYTHKKRTGEGYGIHVNIDNDYKSKMFLCIDKKKDVIK